MAALQIQRDAAAAGNVKSYHRVSLPVRRLGKMFPIIVQGKQAENENQENLIARQLEASKGRFVLLEMYRITKKHPAEAGCCHIKYF